MWSNILGFYWYSFSFLAMNKTRQIKKEYLISGTENCQLHKKGKRPKGEQEYENTT